MVACVNNICSDFPSACRKLIKHGNIKITVNHKCKCSWYGCCTHYKRMNLIALHCQICTLVHTEAVLLVCYNNTEVSEFNIILNKCMCSDNKVCFSVYKSAFYFMFLFGICTSCKQIYFDSCGGKHLGNGIHMLCCQYLRRRH